VGDAGRQPQLTATKRNTIEATLRIGCNGGGVTDLRVASWPHWYAPNRYLDLFYHALRPHAIEHVKHVPLELSARTRHIDAFHLHWAYPYWREGRGGAAGRMLRVARLRRFLHSAHRRNVPVVWTVHNLEHHEGAGVADRAGEALMHAHADLRIFHSHAARQEALVRYPGARGETLIVPHGNYDGALPDAASRAETRAQLGVSGTTRLLLCFGQIRPYKGYDLAVAALEQLPANDYHLVIAGRVAHQEVQDLLDHTTRRNVTVRPGDASDQQLADLFEACDAVLLPYRRITGSGVLLHALTAGRGVVVTDLPYFREVLADGGEAAVFTDAANATAVAHAIEQYFSLPAAYRGRAARSVADRYDWSQLVGPVAEWLHARCARRHVSVSVAAAPLSVSG
jgi:beta-1,4-mannosyltransferase